MTECAAGSSPAASDSGEPVRVSRVLPLYLVVFAGFVGYSLMIAIFTPLVLRADGSMLPRSESVAGRTIALGVLLALYPLSSWPRRASALCLTGSDASARCSSRWRQALRLTG